MRLSVVVLIIATLMMLYGTALSKHEAQNAHTPSTFITTF